MLFAAAFTGAVSGLGHGVSCVGRRGIAVLRCGGFECDGVMNLKLVELFGAEYKVDGLELTKAPSG